MRAVVFALVAAAVLALGAVPAAGTTTNEGLHGAGIRAFTVGGSEYLWKIDIAANRVPTDRLVGQFAFTTESVNPAVTVTYRARPVFLQTNADTACVVGDIGRVQGNPPSPVSQIVFHLQDVSGGLDKFDIFLTQNPEDPAYLCGITSIEATLFGFFTLTDGNFTIVRH